MSLESDEVEVFSSRKSWSPLPCNSHLEGVRLTDRRKRRVLIIVAVSTVVTLSLVLAAYEVLSPAPTPLRGTLSQVGAIHEVAVIGHPAYHFVIFMLSYSSPSSLGASGLTLVIHPPPNGTIRLWNGTTITVAELPFDFASYPPWLTSYPGGGWGTDFTATCVNPDGSTVMGAVPTTFHGSTSQTLAAGALLNVTFGYGMDPVGFSVSISHSGNPGAIEAAVG